MLELFKAQINPGLGYRGAFDWDNFSLFGALGGTWGRSATAQLWLPSSRGAQQLDVGCWFGMLVWDAGLGWSFGMLFWDAVLECSFGMLFWDAVLVHGHTKDHEVLSH